MGAEHSKSVAIMGAGLSGLCLALALHQQGIECIIYESRLSSLDIGGAIMLSPNALRILDRLGVLKRMEPSCYKFESLYFRSEDDKVVDQFVFGSVEKWGYSGMRIYRFELIKVLLAMITEVEIPVEYSKKFDKIVKETENGVTWQFTDGTEASAPMLIGCDGIHSRVRTYLYPDLQPKFTNLVGVTAAVPTSQLKTDPSYKMPVTIMHSKHGAFVIAPQLADGSEVLIGKQYRFTGPEPDREAWNSLTSDKAWCTEFLRQGSEDFPAVVGNATSEVSPDKVNLWPFYLLPKLDTWNSKNYSRVVIVGDAAHAIPPSAGQGVNQAFEDVYTLAGLLGNLGRKGSKDLVKPSLKRWQAGRQERINGVLGLNAQMNERRLPGSNVAEFEPFELDWLYSANFDAMIDEYASGS